MIPQAGSAYAYSYATLGELVAWIIGWDLILEYAVGNIAVAIAWSGYFTSLLSGVRHQPARLPDARLPHGAPQLRSGGPRPAADRAAHRRRAAAAERAGVRDRDADHVAALHRRQGERPRQQHHGRGQAAGAGAVRRASARCTSTRTTTCRSRRTAGAASIRARRSCSSPTSASTRSRRPPRRRKNPQRNMPIGILGGLAICTRDLRRRRHRRDRAGAVSAAARRPIRWRRRCSSPGCRRPSAIVAFGAVVSLTAVLLVFQYGQPRIFFAMARDGLLPAWAREDPPALPHAAHHDAS